MAIWHYNKSWKTSHSQTYVRFNSHKFALFLKRHINSKVIVEEQW
jgi:hypothetical protein